MTSIIESHPEDPEHVPPPLPENEFRVTGDPVQWDHEPILPPPMQQITGPHTIEESDLPPTLKPDIIAPMLLESTTEEGFESIETSLMIEPLDETPLVIEPLDGENIMSIMSGSRMTGPCPLCGSVSGVVTDENLQIWAAGAADMKADPTFRAFRVMQSWLETRGDETEPD